MAKATHLLRKASELVREKSYAEAVEVYLQATETDPTDCRAWFGLGVCLYKIGNLDVARIALERAQKMGYPKAEEALAHLEMAERRRAAEGSGARATVPQPTAPAGAPHRRTAETQPKEPPRPLTRPEEQKLDLDRYLRVMLVENLESDRELITQTLEGTIRHLEVVSVPYGASTSDTMSGTVHYDVVILDWDADPDAAAGLIQILKIKRAALLVICLTEAWDAETAVQIFEAGADYHLVKEPHYVLSLPLILARWAQRDRAIALQQRGKDTDVNFQQWPEALNAVGEMLLYVAADYAVVHANRAAMKAFRMREDQVLGHLYCQALYGREEPPENCAIARALAGGEPATGEITHPHLKKTLVVNVWPEITPGGSVAGAIALLREKAPEELLPQELREREWLYRNVVEHANAGMAMVGPDGTLCYANRGFCTMLDHTADEICNKPVESFVPPEDQQSLRECLEVALDIGEAGGRLNLERTDGSRIPVEARIARFSGEDETYLVLTLIGVGELEEAEKALWAERSKFAGILEKGVNRLECGVTVLDRQGRITWINDLAAQLFATDRDELVGADYADLLRKFAEANVQDADRFLEALAEAHRKGKPLADYVLAFGNSPEGEGLQYWSTPTESGSAAVHRVEHFYTSQGAAPATPLPEGEAQSIAEIAATVPEMLFTTDEEGRITWCNPAAASLAGYSEQKLLGMELASLVSEEDRAALCDMIREALDTGRRISGREVLMSRADGGRFWAELTLLPTRNGHKGLHGALRDVSDKRITDAIRAILNGAMAPS